MTNKHVPIYIQRKHESFVYQNISFYLLHISMICGIMLAIPVPNIYKAPGVYAKHFTLEKLYKFLVRKQHLGHQKTSSHQGIFFIIKALLICFQVENEERNQNLDAFPENLPSSFCTCLHYLLQWPSH